jgi:predicted XRE-type DNA-binding protein
VVAVKTYQVTAKRWERGWELHIDGVGVTQSRTVKDAEEMIRDYLRLEGITGPYDVKIDFRAEDDLDAEIREARRAVAEAARAQAEAAAKVREAVRHLTDRHYRQREVAAVLGVSKQRVSQLLKPKTKALTAATERRHNLAPPTRP